MIQLTKNNNYTFRGPFTQASVEKAQKAIYKLHKKLPKEAVLYLSLDTPGGEVGAGMDLISFINTLERDVHTITFFAASMGFITAQLLGERLVVEDGEYMTHRASGSISGEFNENMIRRLQAIIDWLDTIDNKVAKRLNISHALYVELKKDEAYFIGIKAVNAGIADRLVEVKCSKDLIETKLIVGGGGGLLSIFTGGGQKEESMCPLIRGPIFEEEEKEAGETMPFPFMF